MPIWNVRVEVRGPSKTIEITWSGCLRIGSIIRSLGLVEQPNLVVERRDKITKESGPYIANGAMRSLRAVYNHARRSNTDLPAGNPVCAIDWNKEHRRNTGVGPNDINGWLKELCALDNPLRREFHLFTLLSGSRPTALKKIRLEHVDLQ